MRTSHKAVLLFFDKDLNWTSYLVDNSRQGYNVFDLEGTWQGYVLKNQARGWNEFNLEGDWLGFIAPVRANPLRRHLSGRNCIYNRGKLAGSFHLFRKEDSLYAKLDSLTIVLLAHGARAG